MWQVYNQIPKKSNHIRFEKKIYKLYFRCPLGDQIRWAPRIKCTSCSSGETGWIENAQQCLLLTTLIWRNLRSFSRLLFCLVNVKGFSSKHRSKITYLARLSIKACSTGPQCLHQFLLKMRLPASLMMRFWRWCNSGPWWFNRLWVWARRKFKTYSIFPGTIKWSDKRPSTFKTKIRTSCITAARKQPTSKGCFGKSLQKAQYWFVDSIQSGWTTVLLLWYHKLIWKTWRGPLSKWMALLPCFLQEKP